MNFVRLIYTLLLILTIILGLFLIKYSLKRRYMPGANYFILLLCTTILYSGTYVGELNSSHFSSAILWFHLEHLSIPMQYFWAMMAIEYTGIDKKVKNKLKYLLLYHPVLFFIIYFTNHIHHLYISDYQFISNGYFPVIITEKGFLYAAAVISGTFLALIATYLYILGCIKAPRLQRSSYIIMIVASLLPWSTIYLIATNNNYLGIDFYPGICAFSGILYVYGIFRYNFFNTIPIATEIVFRKAKEGIMLLDLTDRIADANDSAIKLYPELKKLTKESTLNQFTRMHPEYEDLTNDKMVVCFSTDVHQGFKYYKAEVITIYTERHFQIGKIITISDITQLYMNQKRLETIAIDAMDKAELNEMSFLQAQISPHFINNTLSVIGSMITRAPDEAKELITELGEYLTSRYYFDSESGMVPLDKEIETVITYVNIEKARFRERLQFQIIADKIPDFQIPRLVLQPLVENAIRHGILKKAVGGTVKLIIQEEPDKVFFEVVDDGIGMSEDMVSSLLIDQHRQTGIGILNIHKRLQKYYHEGLTIKSSINQGTSVTFTIKLKTEA